MVVIVVVFTVGSKPGLYGLGPVFVVIRSGVFASPKAAGDGGLPGFLEAFIEGGIEVFESHLVDGVGEFVDTDGFGLVRIAGIVKEVFLAAGNRRTLAGGP